jgi:hypothetical protein
MESHQLFESVAIPKVLCQNNAKDRVPQVWGCSKFYRLKICQLIGCFWSAIVPGIYGYSSALWTESIPSFACVSPYGFEKNFFFRESEPFPQWWSLSFNPISLFSRLLASHEWSVEVAAQKS